MSNFLSCGDNEDMNDMFKNLMKPENADNPMIPQELRDKFNQSQSKRIIPKAGMCIKTLAKTAGIEEDEVQKLFLNVCTSDEIPAPEPKTIEEIQSIVKRLHDPGYTNFYRIPMSVGEGHAEIDNRGQGCVAYDIVVNQKFYEKICSAQGEYYIFFLELIREKLEDKYNILLDGEFKVMKNRKCIGTLSHQFIRSQSKPYIQEIDRILEKSEQQNIMQEDTKKNTTSIIPEYTLIQEPLEGHPDYIIAEIVLPRVQTADGLDLQLGEDRIYLKTRSNLYELDLYLPVDLDTTKSGAQFNRNTKILTLTLHVMDK